MKPSLSKAARLTEATMAKAARVDAHHQRNERLNSRPSTTAIRVPMQQKSRMSHRPVVIESRNDNIETALTSNTRSFYRVPSLF